MTALLVIAAIVVLLIGGGMLYQYLSMGRDARRLPPPGRVIDIGTTKLHVDERGTGWPVVIFDAGITATGLSWRRVQPEVAKLTRTLSYDRAGLGWSGPAQGPRNLAAITGEFEGMLERAAPEGPYILVGHSYGTLIAREFAARHPERIAGLVLIDPVSTSEWGRPSETYARNLRRGISLSRRGAMLARLGVVRFALNLVNTGARRMPRFIARVSGGNSGGFTDRMAGEIRKLPREVWPAVQAHWSDPMCFETMARYLESLSESCIALGDDRSLGDLPLVVFSAGTVSAAQRAEHERLARLSTRGRIEILPDCGHWIQLDRPELIIETIREMALAARERVSR
ncbi:MAG TPA: alpha/beta hydrolase [Bryobacteraceae bacterium]|nr:alpha/beta hydrolase [Bryobacteraceae bacterium]